MERLEKVAIGHMNGERYYEALQIFITIANRHNKNGKINESLDVLYNASFQMINKKQLDFAITLANEFVDGLTKNKISNSNSNIDHLQHLITLCLEMPVEVKSKAKEDFWTKSLRFLISEENNKEKVNSKEYLQKVKSGIVSLHRLLGECFAEQEQYGEAQRHLIRAHQPNVLAQMLREWIATGTEDEGDLFLTRTVLQMLCLTFVDDAREVFKRVRESDNNNNNNNNNDHNMDTPLIHFVKYLLQTIDYEAGPLFIKLCNIYQPSLSRDADMLQYINIIGKKYFGIDPPKSSSNNGGGFDFINDMMKSFFAPPPTSQQQQQQQPSSSLTEEDVD